MHSSNSDCLAVDAAPRKRPTAGLPAAAFLQRNDMGAGHCGREQQGRGTETEKGLEGLTSLLHISANSKCRPSASVKVSVLGSPGCKGDRFYSYILQIILKGR